MKKRSAPERSYFQMSVDVICFPSALHCRFDRCRVFLFLILFMFGWLCDVASDRNVRQHFYVAGFAWSGSLL